MTNTAVPAMSVGHGSADAFVVADSRRGDSDAGGDIGNPE